MAATQTVAQRADARNSSNVRSLQVPRHGAVTLYGYGIQVRVDRGHLILEDGIGAERRYARLPRVGHGLRRLVVIGADGYVSLAALQWLADQDAAFVMLERDGSVLATTGPVRCSVTPCPSSRIPIGSRAANRAGIDRSENCRTSAGCSRQAPRLHSGPNR
jgi:hypothetical protein